MSGWIAMHRGEDADLLQERHPAAFLLLCQTARRARWRKDRCTITGLGFGQAMLGDWKSAGLDSEKSYRHAKSVLQRAGLVTFRGANRGTVATLVSQRIFSIETDPTGEQAGDPTDDHKGSVKGERKGRPGATKNKETPNTETPKQAEEEEAPPPITPPANSPREAEDLVAACPRPSPTREALEAALACLKRHAATVTFQQILDATKNATRLIHEWPEDERLAYCPTAAKFFSDDRWRSHPDDFKSRRSARKNLATDRQQQQPAHAIANGSIDIGGRRPAGVLDTSADNNPATGSIPDDHAHS